MTPSRDPPSQRRSPALGVLLCVLAIVGQLLLPPLHAQAWARQSGSALLVAFCGAMTPEQASEFLASLPEELRSELGGSVHPTVTDCGLCDLVHGMGASPELARSEMVLLVPPFLECVAVARASPEIALVMRPPTRGPPLRS